MKKIIIFLFLFTLLGCQNNSNNINSNKELDDEQQVNSESLKLLQNFYSKSVGDTVIVIDNDTLITFRFFDELRDAKQLLFSNNGKLTTLGDTLLYIIQNARFYGLYPDDYNYNQLKTLNAKFIDSLSKLYNIDAIAKAEILFTDAYLKFGAHLNRGRFNPDSIMLEWNPQKLDSNWVKILKLGIQTKNIRKAFDSLEPKHDGYRFLKQAICNYIKENEKIDWDTISFKNKNDSLKFKIDLKQKLIKTGDYKDSLQLNDSLNLANAIKSYQKKFNLEPDGKLGKLTKQVLSLSKEQTIRQMEMALERWRWEPSIYPDRYAFVNIPSAEINIYEKDKKNRIDTLVLNSKIVVGKPETQTPTLQSKINFMLIYPYWSVPYTIAWKEILPMIKRDTNYLHKHNFEVINGKGEVVTNIGSLNWKKYSKDYLPIKFRQRIGNENSLGICKFNFNNKYGVYLHDTNSKRYFKTFYRYQSHGCMRIEKYVDLAKFLIRDDTLRLPYDTLNAYFGRRVQKQINIRKPLPIYVRYYTAIADKNLKLSTYIDIYRKDERMINLIYKK